MKANKVVQHSTMWRSASNAHSMNKHFAPYNFGIGCNECLVFGDKPTKKNLFEYECKIVLPFTWLLFISCQQCGYNFILVAGAQLMSIKCCYLCSPYLWHSAFILLSKCINYCVRSRNRNAHYDFSDPFNTMV